MFRGTKILNFNDYEENGIHYWPLLTSTSKEENIARDFGSNLFKIYLTKENQPPTNINIIGKLRAFDNEEEVLLLPSF